MAIQVMGRLQNIMAALEVHLNATLVATDAVKLQYPEVPFDSRGLTSWVKLDYLPDSQLAPLRSTGSSGNAGRIVSLGVQLTCFVLTKALTGVPVNRFTLPALRDKVLGRVYVGKEIEVKDYHGTPGSVIDVAQFVSVSGTPLASPQQKEDTKGELAAWVITAYLEYIEPHGGT